MKTLQQVQDEFMESEPIKRILAIEDIAIATSRAGQYYGPTIQGEFRKAIKELLEQVVPEKEANQAVSEYYSGFNACRQQVEDRIRKILNN